ncbi:DoxX family membrane protein [Candidatus Woesearchaeota archaeon]|nr:DoxX family membrane protein [Candidatus Woesearchaeota archaeon]
MVKKEQYYWALLRIGLGWTFLWAFLDKLWGLGFATLKENSWLAGGSPTSGFLLHGTKGPLAGVFQMLAGSAFVDWLFMIGLLLLGVSLILGIGVRVAAYAGSLLLFMMWLALLLPANNPFLDEHILYIFALMGLSLVKAGRVWGLGLWWSKQKLVKQNPWME